MSSEKFPTPAAEVIAVKKRRIESEFADAVSSDIDANVLASVSEKLLNDPAATSTPESSNGRTPYEVQVGEPVFQPHNDPRFPTNPSIPAPDISPQASHPVPPPQTL